MTHCYIQIVVLYKSIMLKKIEFISLLGFNYNNNSIM